MKDIFFDFTIFHFLHIMQRVRGLFRSKKNKNKISISTDWFITQFLNQFFFFFLVVQTIFYYNPRFWEFLKKWSWKKKIQRLINKEVIRLFRWGKWVAISSDAHSGYGDKEGDKRVREWEKSSKSVGICGARGSAHSTVRTVLVDVRVTQNIFLPLYSVNSPVSSRKHPDSSPYLNIQKYIFQ